MQFHIQMSCHSTHFHASMQMSPYLINHILMIIIESSVEADHSRLLFNYVASQKGSVDE